MSGLDFVANKIGKNFVRFAKRCAQVFTMQENASGAIKIIDLTKGIKTYMHSVKHQYHKNELKSLT